MQEMFAGEVGPVEQEPLPKAPAPGLIEHWQEPLASPEPVPAWQTAADHAQYHASDYVLSRAYRLFLQYAVPEASVVGPDWWRHAGDGLSELYIPPLPQHAATPLTITPDEAGDVCSLLASMLQVDDINSSETDGCRSLALQSLALASGTDDISWPEVLAAFYNRIAADQVVLEKLRLQAASQPAMFILSDKAATDGMQRDLKKGEYRARCRSGDCKAGPSGVSYGWLGGHLGSQATCKAELGSHNRLFHMHTLLTKWAARESTVRGHDPSALPLPVKLQHALDKEKSKKEESAVVTAYHGVNWAANGWRAKCNRCKDEGGRKKLKHLGSYKTDVMAAFVHHSHITFEHAGMAPRAHSTGLGKRARPADETGEVLAAAHEDSEGTGEAPLPPSN